MCWLEISDHCSDCCWVGICGATGDHPMPVEALKLNCSKYKHYIDYFLKVRKQLGFGAIYYRFSFLRMQLQTKIKFNTCSCGLKFILHIVNKTPAWVLNQTRWELSNYSQLDNSYKCILPPRLFVSNVYEWLFVWSLQFFSKELHLKSLIYC